MKILGNRLAYPKEGIGGDRFISYLLVFFILGILNLVFFFYNFPFPVIYGPLLYKLHGESIPDFKDKKYLRYFYFVFGTLFLWRLLLLLGINLQAVGLSEEGYIITFLIMSAFSLILFPLKIYLSYKLKKETDNTEKIILINQLAIISLLIGFSIMLILFNRIYPIDLAISLTYLIIAQIVLACLIKGIYLWQHRTAFLPLIKTPSNDSHVSLSSAEAQEIEPVLREIVEGKKIYLRTDLSLQLLSDESKIPTHKLSHYFNQVLNKTFYEYIAEYRIQYAVENMHSSKNDYTIEAIAFGCGFNSVTTFNKYFKMYMGSNPAEYRLKLKGA